MSGYPNTQVQQALLEKITAARMRYLGDTSEQPNTVVLSHAQHTLLRQPNMVEGMYVVIAFAGDNDYPRCVWAEERIATTPIETRSEMQVLFERDCAGRYNFFRLGNGEYLSHPTHNAFTAYQLGYAAGKVAQ